MMTDNKKFPEWNEIRPGVTVIVCCYNSEKRLPETLQWLAAQRVPASIAWEILIIDNASSDGTASKAMAVWNEISPGSDILRVIHESRAGQQFARIRGAEEGKFDILIFCDDDNWLDPSYVSVAFDTMKSHPLAGAAGGRNIPHTDAVQYPDWFETYADKYALGTPAAESGDISWRGFVLGAGMVTRRTVFLAMYTEKYPSLLKGRKGQSLSTGDDFEYCKRLLLRGWRLYYNQDLLLTHFIPEERLTIPYRERLMQGIFAAGEVINEYDLALRVFNRFKNKNRWRLLFLTPFRIALVKLGMMNRVLIDEELTYFYLSPFSPDKNSVRKKIKDFIYGR